MTTISKTVSARPACAIPDTPLAHAAAGLDLCVHCGFCLQACPTYVNLEDENDSPRGRLVLMSRMLDGEISITDPDASKHLDRCLGCRACETACPSGVPYGELLEATRATMAAARGLPFIARLILATFKHTTLLSIVLTAARVFRNSGVPRVLAGVLPARLAFPMAMLASTTPSTIRARRTAPAGAADSSAPTDTKGVANQQRTATGNAGTARTSVSPLTGCVMQGLFGHVNDATTRVLSHNGYTVRHTAGQHCCGALHAHAGDLEGARELARRNIAAFETSGADVIAVNSAGCGAMCKQYGHLLHDDAAWAPRAEALASKVRDISELLASAGPVPGAPLPLRVTHDPPCHQMHAQRIVKQPLQLLAAIPALDLVDLPDADQCCGSAGIYNLLEPETSDAVLAPKLRCIADTNAEYLATGNPGCMMQIGAGLLRSGASTRVVHPIELLDASYRNA
ncbi:MAG: 4Fe-4S dicluster domain-containing protein [Gemmatimonadaceae bacterium]|nr:4Fe-4S dicluster domain-containing protein [Gemmatimonadaceae bacterium]